MKSSSTLRRNVVAMTGAGLVATPLLALATPAFAAGCQTSTPAATEIAPGICEVQFTTPGDTTFTAPSGITKLTAIVVGAGGSHYINAGDYAGGGGDVVYVSSVDMTAAIDVSVGAGASGTDGSVVQGGDSSVGTTVAAGGFTGSYIDALNQGFWGGTSGNGNDGYPNDLAASGGGAGGDFIDQYTGGPGVTASSIADDATLWPALVGEPAYGPGGNATVAPGGVGAAVAGAGANTTDLAGADGAVIFRWAGPADASLPTTGLSAWNSTMFAMFAGGLALLAFVAFGARDRVKFASNRERLVGLLRRSDETLRRTEKSDDES